MQKLLHTVPEAMDAVSLKRTKFYQEVAAGRITIVKAGGKSLVPQASLDRYVENLIAQAGSSKAAA